jgi:hypothetical protein
MSTERQIYDLNLAPSIYCGLKRLAAVLGARFRYEFTREPHRISLKS